MSQLCLMRFAPPEGHPQFSARHPGPPAPLQGSVPSVSLSPQFLIVTGVDGTGEGGKGTTVIDFCGDVLFGVAVEHPIIPTINATPQIIAANLFISTFLIHSELLFYYPSRLADVRFLFFCRNFQLLTYTHIVPL